MKLFKPIRFHELQSFTREFFGIVLKIRSVLLVLIGLIAIGGWMLALVESLDFWEGQYLAFVTALTIGYGDLIPNDPLGKIICILLGVLGMIWVGMIVAVSSIALKRSVETEEPKPEIRDGQ